MHLGRGWRALTSRGTPAAMTMTDNRPAARSAGDGAWRLNVLGPVELTYDGVVVVAPDEIAAESIAGVRVLYVALTRATHRLVTVAAGDGWLPEHPVVIES